MAPFVARETTEVFWILVLDSQHRVIEVSVKNEESGEIERVVGPIAVTRGIVDSSLVHPLETFKPAILHGATAMVAHNHPSAKSRRL
jgi:DNA repair protein RadC